MFVLCRFFDFLTPGFFDGFACYKSTGLTGRTALALEHAKMLGLLRHVFEKKRKLSGDLRQCPKEGKK